MARETITLDASVDDAWPQLQSIAIWEGVAGIENLSDPTHDASQNLTGFRFEVDTALGRVRGDASVEAKKPGMVIRGQQKGLAITIELVLTDVDGSSSKAIIEASAKSTSFVSKPLAATLNSLLSANLHKEAEKIAERVDSPPLGG